MKELATLLPVPELAIPVHVHARTHTHRQGHTTRASRHTDPPTYPYMPSQVPKGTCACMQKYKIDLCTHTQTHVWHLPFLSKGCSRGVVTGLVTQLFLSNPVSQ